MEISIDYEAFTEQHDMLEHDSDYFKGLDGTLSDTSSTSQALEQFKARVNYVKQLKNQYAALLQNDNEQLQKTAQELRQTDIENSLIYAVDAFSDYVEEHGLSGVRDGIRHAVQEHIEDFLTGGDGEVKA